MPSPYNNMECKIIEKIWHNTWIDADNALPPAIVYIKANEMKLFR